MIVADIAIVVTSSVVGPAFEIIIVYVAEAAVIAVCQK